MNKQMLIFSRCNAHLVYCPSFAGQNANIDCWLAGTQSAAEELDLMMAYDELDAVTSACLKNSTFMGLFTLVLIISSADDLSSNAFF